MDSETKLILLTKGYSTIVDDQDYDWLMQWKWCVHGRGPGAFYAARGARIGGRQRSFSIHRELASRIGLSTAALIDHRNGNPLDNRRANIRAASVLENNRNCVVKKLSTSGCKGIRYRPERGKWTAQIRINGTTLHLGEFDTPTEALLSYWNSAVKHFGEFARMDMDYAKFGRAALAAFQGANSD